MTLILMLNFQMIMNTNKTHYITNKYKNKINYMTKINSQLKIISIENRKFKIKMNKNNNQSIMIMINRIMMRITMKNINKIILRRK